MELAIKFKTNVDEVSKLRGDLKAEVLQGVFSIYGQALLQALQEKKYEIANNGDIEILISGQALDKDSPEVQDKILSGEIDEAQMEEWASAANSELPITPFEIMTIWTNIFQALCAPGVAPATNEQGERVSIEEEADRLLERLLGNL